jgi:general nucleoside transport system permease protein
MLESVLAGAVGGGTSILYPTLGEVVAERSGVINLGTEGSMLCGALAAYAVGIGTGSPWLGVLAGLGAGALLAAVHAFVVLWRGANQLATGLVVSFLGLGLTSLFGQDYVGRGVEPLDDWDVPGLHSLPFVGRVLFEHDPLTYLSIAVAVGAWWVLRRTRAGVRLRAAGERPEVLATFGSSPRLVRCRAVIVGGALAGLGGAQLATAFTRNWSEGMTAGRGFIAVGLTIFAAWDPLKAIAGAYLFSGAEALQLELQAQGTSLSPFLLQALPYVVVIVALAALSGRRLGRAPEALSRVFEGRAA